MSTATDPDDASATDRGEVEVPHLDAWLETREDGPDRYTVAPAWATGHHLMTRWMTVPESIVCDLHEMR